MSSVAQALPLYSVVVQLQDGKVDGDEFQEAVTQVLHKASAEKVDLSNEIYKTALANPENYVSSYRIIPKKNKDGALEQWAEIEIIEAKVKQLFKDARIPVWRDNKSPRFFLVFAYREMLEGKFIQTTADKIIEDNIAEKIYLALVTKAWSYGLELVPSYEGPGSFSALVATRDRKVPKVLYEKEQNATVSVLVEHTGLASRQLAFYIESAETNEPLAFLGSWDEQVEQFVEFLWRLTLKRNSVKGYLSFQRQIKVNGLVDLQTWLEFYQYMKNLEVVENLHLASFQAGVAFVNLFLTGSWDNFVYELESKRIEANRLVEVTEPSNITTEHDVVVSAQTEESPQEILENVTNIIPAYTWN